MAKPNSFNKAFASSFVQQLVTKVMSFTANIIYFINIDFSAKIICSLIPKV